MKDQKEAIEAVREGEFKAALIIPREFSRFLNVIFYFPSGAIYPIASFPPRLKAFAKVNPETYAVDALKSLIFKNAGIPAISGDIAFLAVFAAITMTMAIATFKRTL